MRGRSITGPLVLVGIGVLFLLSNLRIGFSPYTLFVQYWPFVVIFIGVIGLVEVLIHAGRGEENIPRPVAGGWIFWIVILCVIGSMANGRNTFRFGPFNDFQTGFSGGFFGTAYEYDLKPAAMQQLAGQGITRILVDNTRGSISIRGDAAGDVKLTGHRSIRATSRVEADRTNEQFGVEMKREGDTLVIRTAESQSSSPVQPQITAEMDLTVPRGINLEVRGRRGDVTLDDLDGLINVAGTRGDIHLSRLARDVKVEGTRTGLVRISDVKGNVDLQGRGNDVQLENIAGQVTVSGEYSGDLEFRALAKPMRFQSSRTEFRVEGVPGSIQMDLGDLKLTNVTGPVRFSTTTRDIEAIDVSSALDLNVERGDIQVTASKAPLPRIDVRSRRGDIVVSLPEKAGFQLRGTTGQGETENEFGTPLTSQSRGRGSVIEGKNGAGPEINVETDRGTVVVKKL